MNQSQLLALAITSGNDYSPNVKGFGIKKNSRIIATELNEKNDTLKIVKEYETALVLESGDER